MQEAERSQSPRTDAPSVCLVLGMTDQLAAQALVNRIALRFPPSAQAINTD